MRLFVTLFLLCLVAGVVLAPTPVSYSASPDNSPPSSISTNHLAIGTASCAASGCHHAGGPRGTIGSEYSTWAAYDPHVHAAEVLNSDRSRRMVSLFRRVDLDKAKPLEDVLCLSCHATDKKPNEQLGAKSHADFITADGVGCESCHGPAEKWKTKHYREEWKSLNDEAKHAAGLNSTKDLTVRIDICAGCHVGGPDKEVNHDLIAAGHPRLAFDFAAYQQIYPKHWTAEKLYPSDFDAWTWIIGQVGTAQSAMNLLHSRAGKAAKAFDDNAPASWPEFAEGSCFACHHNLTADDQAGSWRQQRGAMSGPMPWGRWYLPGSEFLLKHAGVAGLPIGDPDLFAKVQLEMKPQLPNPKGAAHAAGEAQQRLHKWSMQLNEAALAGKRITPESLRELSALVVQSGVAPGGIREWDDAAQNYLALAALAYARNNTIAAERDGILSLRKPLAFPASKESRTRWDSPRDFRPQDYINALKQLAPQ